MIDMSFSRSGSKTPEQGKLIQRRKVEEHNSSTIGQNTPSGSVAVTPDGGFGWMVVFTVFMIHFIMDGIGYSFGVLLSELLDKFESSTSETSWIMSVLIGTTFGCGPLPSWIGTRFGRRPVAVIGGLLACLGCFLSSFATAVWQLILLFGFVTGLGCGFVYLPAVVSVNQWFQQKRALAVGIAVCGSGVGMMVFNPFTRYLLDEYGVSGCLIIYAGILLNCCVFAMLLRPTPAESSSTTRSSFLPENIIFSPLEVTSTDCDDNTDKVLESSTLKTWSRKLYGLTRQMDIDSNLMREWRFWVFGLTAFLSGISCYIPFAFLPHRAETEAGILKDNAAYLMSAMGFANLAGRLASSAISDLRCQNRVVMYCVMWAVAGLATSLSIFSVNYGLFMLYSVIFGFSQGYITALQSVVLTDIVGLEKLSSAFGILLFLQGAAVFVGPPFAGTLVDHFDGDYTVTFIVFGLIMFLAGLCLLIVPVFEFIKNGYKQKMHMVDVEGSKPK